MVEAAKNWLQGKRGVVMGVANDRSIAWGISKAAHEAGAELAFTYQGEALEKRVRPLAESIGSDIVLPCDVTDMNSVDQVFETIGKKWVRLILSCTPSPFPTRMSWMDFISIQRVITS